jgi:hypothetical protein
MTVACPVVLTDDVREHCAAIAASARHVRIDPHVEIEPGGISGLDPQLHFLEGSREQVARYVLTLDAINFGSGWFEELGVDTEGLTARLTAHVREHGPWGNEALRALDAAAVGAVLGLDPAHALTRLYAEALNQLGAFLADRPALSVLAPTAEATAQRLTAMPFFDDRGFYKRAQITAHDLHLAGVADFPDLDRLTVFADNLVSHVLRLDGVLAYSDELARLVDAGVELPAGGEHERELRACAVIACEALAPRLGVRPSLLDNWIWNRGLQPPYSERRPHRTRTVYY